METSQDAVTLLRLLANQKRKRHVQCCEQRPHLLVEGLEHIPNDDDNDVRLCLCWCLCCVCVCVSVSLCVYVCTLYTYTYVYVCTLYVCMYVCVYNYGIISATPKGLVHNINCYLTQ